MSVDLQQRPRTLVAAADKPFVANNQKGMADLWQFRHLIAVMVKRDLLGRYRGSVMGLFWTILNPLGQLLLYTFVFSVILKVRFGVSGGTTNFALYLMAGLLPFTAIAESLMRAVSVIAEHPNLVKRVVFPLEILSFSVVCSALISECVGIAILIVIAACMGYWPHATIVFLPLILASQFLFVAGFSWLLASLGVYLTDLRHIMPLALSMWMYSSPIVYPASALPENFKFLLWINPVAGIVDDTRRVLLEGRMPDWQTFATYTGIGIAFWFFGYFFFNKAKRSFADVM
jgi:lipopolysaccharide transport system permease protein